MVNTKLNFESISISAYEENNPSIASTHVLSITQMQ